MNPNYRTLNKDIGMIQRTNNGWDLWFDNGDLVKAEDFHSLQVGIIIACLTSWNYMNRYGNPTYEVFGNRAYQLLKANKSSMVQYKIEQFFLECLKRMRRVYDVVSLTVSEVPYDPYKYVVEFEVISINNQLVDGSFTITTDASKSTSYIDYNVYMPYASDENDLVIDLWLKNEYGGGLEGEILYMYLQKGDGEYEFYDVVGRTDETGYLRVTYTPTESNENNVVYFDFHGNSTYNPSTSKRTGFKTELFSYDIKFSSYDVVTYSNYADLSVSLTKTSLLDGATYVMDYTTVTIIGSDGKIYEVLTDHNGVANVRVNIADTTTFTTTYNNSEDDTTVTLIKQTPTIEFTTNKVELYNDETLSFTALVSDEFGNAIDDLTVSFHDGDDIIGTAVTVNGVASFEKYNIGAKSWNVVATTSETSSYSSVSSESVGILISKHTMDIDLSLGNNNEYYVGNSIVFNATLTENGEMVNGIMVAFMEEDEIIGEIMATNGVASFSINSLDSGEHRITAIVYEDEFHYPCSDSIEAYIHELPLFYDDAIIYQPTLDGTENFYKINSSYTPTYSTVGGVNQVCDACGYLSDGWDNTINWKLSFEYYYNYARWGDSGALVTFDDVTARDRNSLQFWGQSLNSWQGTSRTSVFEDVNVLISEQWNKIEISKNGSTLTIVINDTNTYNVTNTDFNDPTRTRAVIGLDNTGNTNHSCIRNIQVTDLSTIFYDDCTSDRTSDYEWLTVNSFNGTPSTWAYDSTNHCYNLGTGNVGDKVYGLVPKNISNIGNCKITAKVQVNSYGNVQIGCGLHNNDDTTVQITSRLVKTNNTISIIRVVPDTTIAESSQSLSTNTDYTLEFIYNNGNLTFNLYNSSNTLLKTLTSTTNLLGSNNTPMIYFAYQSYQTAKLKEFKVESL